MCISRLRVVWKYDCVSWFNQVIWFPRIQILDMTVPLLMSTIIHSIISLHSVPTVQVTKSKSTNMTLKVRGMFFAVVQIKSLSVFKRELFEVLIYIYNMELLSSLFMGSLVMLLLKFANETMSKLCIVGALLVFSASAIFQMFLISYGVLQLS